MREVLYKTLIKIPPGSEINIYILLMKIQRVFFLFIYSSRIAVVMSIIQETKITFFWLVTLNFNVASVTKRYHKDKKETPKKQQSR